MPILTAITAQRRNQERVNIFLDGEYAFSLSMVTAAYLRIGQQLTDEKVAELRVEDDYERAKEAALNLITYRPRSVQEVRRKLETKEYDEQTIERVVLRLQELALLDDEAFARYWVEQREAFRPRSQMALRQELSQKGVSRDVLQNVLGEVDEDDAAVRAADKKAQQWANLPEDIFRQKVGAFLQRRGFGYAIVAQATRTLWQTYGQGATD